MLPIGLSSVRADAPALSSPTAAGVKTLITRPVALAPVELPLSRIVIDEAAHAPMAVPVASSTKPVISSEVAIGKPAAASSTKPVAQSATEVATAKPVTASSTKPLVSSEVVTVKPAPASSTNESVVSTSTFPSPLSISRDGSFIKNLVAASKREPVRIAQLNQEDSNAPAATPEERPRGLEVPIGPEQADGAQPATPPPDTTTPAPATPPLVVPETTPDLPPIIGNVADAAGREISDVRVVGNRVVPAETILAQVRSTRGSAFSARQAELDRARIDKIGFFASVQAQVAPDPNDVSKIILTYIVTENRVVTAYRFTGNAALKSDELVPVLKSKIGVVLNRNTINEDVAAINKIYQDKGFIALVQNAAQSEDGTLVFSVVEARVSKIELAGLTKTRAPLVRRQIRLKSGDLFDSSKLQRDLNRLYDLNFFEGPPVPKVDDDPDQSGAVIVTLQFAEKRTGTFSVGLGFDSRSRISGFLTVSENNFRGSGKRVLASLETGSRRNYELSYGNPFIGPKNASYDISVYERSIFREPRLVRGLIGGDAGISDSVSYEEQRTGGRISFSQPLDFDRQRTVIFGYRNERARLSASNVDFTDDDINTNLTAESLIRRGLAEELLKVLNDRGTISAPSLGFLLDKRDVRVDPSRGSRVSLIGERGLNFLGGTTSFTKFDFDARRYIPITGRRVNGQPQIVLASRLVASRAFGGLPAFEQYYIGGSETVRGYDTEEQFGDNQIFGNLELRYRFPNRFQAVLFADAGRAYGGEFSSDRDNIANGRSNVLFSVGVGARIQTPVGPVRLDIGRGDRGVRTHFGIGGTF